MSTVTLQPDEIVRRGEAIYQDRIRPQVEADHSGEFLVINVVTGEFEMDPDDLTASRRAKARLKNAPLFTLRVGHPAAYRLGGHFQVAIS
jgi:hypothetical protein